MSVSKLASAFALPGLRGSRYVLEAERVGASATGPQHSATAHRTNKLHAQDRGVITISNSRNSRSVRPNEKKDPPVVVVGPEDLAQFSSLIGGGCFNVRDGGNL